MKNKRNFNTISAGVITAFIASLCCITPIIALFAGVSGFASTFSWLEPLRPLFIALAIIFLCLAWIKHFKSNKVECDCEQNKWNTFFQSKKFLTFISIFAIIFITFPSYSSIFFSNNSINSEVINNQQTIQIEIEGMTCESCEVFLNQTVNKLDCVHKSKADFINGTAVIEFNPEKISPDKIKTAINETGYKVND
jgi:mercuric ion transport protein